MTLTPTEQNGSSIKKHSKFQLPVATLSDGKCGHPQQSQQTTPGPIEKRRMPLTPTDQNVNCSKNHSKFQLPVSTLFDVKRGHSLPSPQTTPSSIGHHSTIINKLDYMAHILI